MADTGPVTCGAIVEAISGGAVAGTEATSALGGFAAYGDSLRGVVDGLTDVSGSWIAADGGRLKLAGAAGAAYSVDDQGSGVGVPGKRGARAIAPIDTAPVSLAITHYDPARDYQSGLQRAVRPGAGRRHVQIDLAASLEAGAAKSLATAALARAETALERRTVAVDWRHLAIAPGARMTVAGESGRWRVAGWSFERMILSLDLARIARAPVPVTASAGRAATASDEAAGDTLLHVFEIPPLDDAVLNVPRLTVAAAGTGPGWRRAMLQISRDSGERWVAAGVSAAPGVIGTLTLAPGAAPFDAVDLVNEIEVELAAPFMALGSATAAAVQMGANMALVGNELLQFGSAEQIGAARWRLTQLWRGCRGTEQAIGTAGIGDRFILLDPATLACVDLPAAALGQTVQVMAASSGDAVVAETHISGASVLPPSPTNLASVVRPDGDVELSWVRRSRAGWGWIDGLDAPLAEETESYSVAVELAGAVIFSLTTDEPRAVLPSIVAVPGALAVVRQRGIFGLGGPARREIP